MSRHPYHRRYHSDALTGYRELTLEQRGAYTTILDLLYDAAEDSLPGNERWWAGQLGVSTRKWRTIRDELAQAGKIDILADGSITNRRYLRELARDRELSPKRSEAGRKGGLARQGSLPLNDENERSSSRVQPEFGPSSTPENDLNRNRNEDEQAGKPAENRETGQASASDLPSYARATNIRTRVIDSSPPVESRTAGATTNDDDPAPIPQNVVLDALARLAKVGAVPLNPARPGPYLREVDIVRGWISDGIDLEATATPAIARRLGATAEDRISSLRFYDADVRRAHARSLNGDGTPRGPSAFDDDEAKRAYIERMQGRPH